MERTTVDTLIADTLAIDNTPVNQGTFTNLAIAKMLDEEMRSAVIPMVMRLREEYFVTVMSIAVDQTTSHITIPGQAAGFRLRSVQLYDANTGQFLTKMNRVNPDQLPYMGASGIGVGAQSTVPTFHIENNDIVVYPPLPGAFTMKIRYMKAPNHLYPQVTCMGQVTAKSGSNQITLSNIPVAPTAILDWTLFTGVNAVTVDVVTPDAPFNHRTSITTGVPLSNLSMTAVNTGTGVVTLANTDAYNSVVLGDWLCTNNMCGYVQYLPYEAYLLIKLRASMRILKAQADMQNLAVTAQLYNAAADDLSSLMAPKVESQPKKVIPRSLIGNASGFRGSR